MNIDSIICLGAWSNDERNNLLRRLERKEHSFRLSEVQYAVVTELLRATLNEDPDKSRRSVKLAIDCRSRHVEHVLRMQDGTVLYCGCADCKRDIKAKLTVNELRCLTAIRLAELDAGCRLQADYQDTWKSGIYFLSKLIRYLDPDMYFRREVEVSSVWKDYVSVTDEYSLYDATCLLVALKLGVQNVACVPYSCTH